MLTVSASVLIKSLDVGTHLMAGSTSTPGTGLPGALNKDYAFISKPAIDIYVDQNKVSPNSVDVEGENNVLMKNVTGQPVPCSFSTGENVSTVIWSRSKVQ